MIDILATWDLPLANTPFGHMVQLCGVLMIATWVLSILTREYSWVDRVWSTAPPVYVTYVAWTEGFEDLRLNVMAILVCGWGVRLTYNFARKGGFTSGGEDYRWAVLKEKFGGAGFQVFNITFIAGYQNLLIWGFCAPIHTAWVFRGTPWSNLDTVAVVMFLGFLLIETVADEQMWRFQEDKRARVGSTEANVQGFYRQGLYRYSRHPNYFGELGQWWVFYLFAVAASGTLWHWTLTGVVLLTLLFHGSIRFGESISASKYPSYHEYQSTTSRIFPWPAR